MKRRRKKTDDSVLNIEAYTRQPWVLEKMTLPHSDHKLPENLLPDMSALLTLNDNLTFEVKCPINTFTGRWTPSVNAEETAAQQDAEQPVFSVEQTTAALGNEVILRAEDWLVDMLKNVRNMRLAHTDTHLILRDADDQVIGILKQQPEERRTFFK
jgi:hypothetical protein